MTKSIVLAAGCFWGVEELIRAVKGVTNTEVGYCGGNTPDPTYETVKTGRTGHAEAVKIDFDPDVLPMEKLLKLFFQLHDPTTLNRQGNDTGTQYRSAIFVANQEQRIAAENAIRETNATGQLSKPVATTIEDLIKFYPAEPYHQDYLRKNPGGYTCHYWRGPHPE